MPVEGKSLSGFCKLSHTYQELIHSQHFKVSITQKLFDRPSTTTATNSKATKMTKTDVKNVARKSRRKRDRHKKSTSSEEDRPRTATLKRPFILDESLKDKVSLNLGGGCISHLIAFSLCNQQPRVRFLAFPKFFPGHFSEKEKIGLMKKLSMLPRLISSTAAQSSGQQRPNYIDRTHLVLASGKLVLQKSQSESSNLIRFIDFGTVQLWN